MGPSIGSPRVPSPRSRTRASVALAGHSLPQVALKVRGKLPQGSFFLCQSNSWLTAPNRTLGAMEASWTTRSPSTSPRALPVSRPTLTRHGTAVARPATPGCVDTEDADYCSFVLSLGYCDLIGFDCLKTCDCCDEPSACGSQQGDRMEKLAFAASAKAV